MDQAVLSVAGVRKSFGPRQVLKGVDLCVRRGRILGLMGVNGAGKTTLLSVIAGLRRPDAGRVRIAGVDVSRDRTAAARHIGMAPQALGIYPTLTVRENLECFAGLSGLFGRHARERVAEVAELLGLSEALAQLAGRLSGGQQRRLHTGMAMLHRPDLLLLDEPTVGADVLSRAALLNVVAGMAESGSAVIYTTHYPAELEQLNADIAVLDGGRITVEGDVSTVVRTCASPSVTLRFHGPVPTLDGWARRDQALVPELPVTDPAATVADALKALGHHADGLEDVDIVRPSLESAYLKITGSTGHNAQTDQEACDVAVA